MTISARPQTDSRNASPALAPAGPRHARIAAPPGDDQCEADHQCRQQQARHDAGHEQGSDRGIGRDAVQHQDDRGRQQDAERAGCGDDAGAEALRIAVFDHGRQDDRADRDHGRDTGAGNGGEQCRGRDTSQAQATRPMADQGRGEGDHAPSDAAARQERARQDKERDRHDREIIEAGEQLQPDAFDRHRGHGEHERQDRQTQRDRDRHAGQHQGGQDAEDQGRAHAPVPSSSFCPARSSTWPASWCGTSPVRQKCTATCRKRKHMR